MTKTITAIISLALISVSSYLYFSAKQGLNKEGKDQSWGHGKDIMPKNQTEFEKMWDHVADDWVFKEGKIHTSEKNEGDRYLLYKSPIIGDVAIEFDAMVKDQEALKEGADLSIILLSEKNLSKRYDLQIGGKGNQNSSIQMIDIPLAISDFTVKPGLPYHIRAEKDDDALRLFCNGQLLLETHNKYFLNGTFHGIYSYGKGKSFWNIKIFKKSVSFEVSPFKVPDLFYANALALPNKTNSNFNKARAAYLSLTKSLNKKKDIEKAFLRLADLEKAVGDFKQMNFYIEKLKLLKDSQKALSLRAEALYLQGKSQEGLSLLKTAIEKYPNNDIEIAGVAKLIATSNASHSISDDARNQLWKIFIKHFNSNSLVARNFKIENIDFLEDTKFEILSLSNNKIVSLESLRNQTLAKSIGLNNNNITDLSPLENLKIKILALSYNPVQDINALIKLPLNNLEISNTQIDDAKPLGKIKSLKKLQISHTKIRDLSPIKSLNLESLSCTHLNLKDTSSIPKDELINLEISNNSIQKLNAKEYPKLKGLNLSNNQITSLKGFNMGTLNFLNIDGNPITDLSPMYEAPPKRFLFNCPSLSKDHLQEAINRWSPKENLTHHVALAKVYMALKEAKPKESLKKLSQKFNSHSYLFIPLQKSAIEAQKYCQSLGGNLVSITSKEEDIFIKGLKGFIEPAWIGLQRKGETPKWLTQEDFYFTQEAKGRTSEGHFDANYICYPKIGKNWDKVYTNSSYEYYFIIEWE